MNLKQYLQEAAEKVEELDEKKFFLQKEESQKEFTDKYVQHRELDARNWFPFLRLEGVVSNTSRIHFGNGGAENLSIVKKAVYESGYKPLLSDNAIGGMFRIPLQTISRQIWGNDEEITECGCFTEAGSRFQCLKCLGCGLAGGLKPDTGDNVVHKVSAITGVSKDAEIITEWRNALEPRTGTTPKWQNINPKNEGKKLAALWQMEYVAPDAHFPISITFRDVAAAELGLALTAFDISWKNIGLGSHKNGRLQGWYDSPDDFALYAWMEKWLEEPESYRGKDLLEIINLAKKAAYIAQQKKLLVKYVLDTSKLRGVRTEKVRSKTRGG